MCGPLICHQFPEPLHHILRAHPRHRDSLELPWLGFVGLGDQPVHGEVPPREGHVAGTEGERGAEVISSVPDVEDSLVRAPPLLRPAGHVVLDDHLLAHVVWAPGAVVRVEGPQHQPPVLVEGRGVGKDPVEQLAGPDAPEPALYEVSVGVGQQYHLKVLRGPVAEELEEGEHAGCGRYLLHDAAYVALGDPLLRQVGQHPLHVFVVAAGLISVRQPPGEVLTRDGLHDHVIAGFIHDGLVEVKEDQEALVRGDVSWVGGHDL